MSFFTALLLALWAGYCSFDDQGPQMLRRPLLVGPIAGIILGELEASLVMSATLELMWMGLGNMAGYMTPDMIVGTISGIIVATSTGDALSAEAIAAGIAAATTVAVLVQQLNTLTTFIRQFFAPWADKLCETGNFDSVLMIQYTAAVLQILVRAIPTFLFAYYSDGIINNILAIIPTDVLKALSTASGLLPAVGLSILMTLMMKPIMWPFLIFGFICSTQMGLSTLGVTLLSLAIAVLYNMIMEIKAKQDAAPSVVVAASDEEDYDL